MIHHQLLPKAMIPELQLQFIKGTSIEVIRRVAAHSMVFTPSDSVKKGQAGLYFGGLGVKKLIQGAKAVAKFLPMGQKFV